MKCKLLMIAAFMIPCVMTVSCGGDDDDDGNGKESVENNERPITVTYVDIKRDESFKPDASYIQKVWAGEYEGWDAVQKKNTTIRRRLTLNPNGTYTNIIAGKLIESGKNQFFKFEAEGGKYTYNPSTRTVNYTCEYDSMLDYRNQTYTRYNKKHYYSREAANYTEKADFSESREGRRVWITKDTYLQALTAEDIDIAFSMSEYNGDNQHDQNK